MHDKSNHILHVPYGVSELKDNSNDISLGKKMYNDKQQKGTLA